MRAPAAAFKPVSAALQGRYSTKPHPHPVITPANEEDVMAIDEAKLNELPGQSDVGTTAPPQPPIGRYQRVPVQVHQADPHAPQVARRLIALIATRWPAHIPAITQALLELGFQPQRPAAFPATRPMLWGTYRHRATQYRVHVHVVPAGSPEVAAMRGLRDALGADPVLRRRYVALKRAIVAGGPADPVAFTKAKHDWIAATLAHLGLADEPPRRLYQDDLDPDNPDRLAS
jgi:GrpB protein